MPVRVWIGGFVWQVSLPLLAAGALVWAGSAARAAAFDESILAESGPVQAAPIADEGLVGGEVFDPVEIANEGTEICSDCPQSPDCRPGCRCDACEPPYGLVNRLIDNKQACWTARVDAVLLWRNSPRTQSLYDFAPPSAGTALNAHQIESTPAGGPRFSLFRTNGCGDALELTYFRAANFRGRATLPTRIDGYVPVYAPVPNAVDTVSANLGASFQSFELNGRMTVWPILQLLNGFRWIEWRESLQMSDFSSQTAPPLASSISTNCMNSLYGYQIGFDSVLLSTRWLRVEGLMKGGAYYNNAFQQTVASTPYQARVGTPHGAAFAGELGMTGIVPITRHWDFRFGYLGLWLEGLAQPTNQKQTLDPAVPATLDLTGGTVLQGITLGLEGRW